MASRTQVRVTGKAVVSSFCITKYHAACLCTAVIPELAFWVLKPPYGA